LSCSSVIEAMCTMIFPDCCDTRPAFPGRLFRHTISSPERIGEKKGLLTFVGHVYEVFVAVQLKRMKRPLSTIYEFGR